MIHIPSCLSYIKIKSIVLFKNPGNVIHHYHPCNQRITIISLALLFLFSILAVAYARSITREEFRLILKNNHPATVEFCQKCSSEIVRIKNKKMQTYEVHIDSTPEWQKMANYIGSFTSAGPGTERTTVLTIQDGIVYNAEIYYDTSMYKKISDKDLKFAIAYFAYSKSEDDYYKKMKINKKKENYVTHSMIIVYDEQKYEKTGIKFDKFNFADHAIFMNYCPDTYRVYKDKIIQNNDDVFKYK